MGKYYLGLDIGTNSVGWAVTNEQYTLIKKKGKDLWGVREFDKAQTAVERRTHRVARRNRQREQVRVTNYRHSVIERLRFSSGNVLTACNGKHMCE